YLHCHSRLQLSITGSWAVIIRWRPVITKHLQWGRGLFCLLTLLLPVSLGTLLWMVSSVLTVKHQYIAP
ncbi:unnamed protein product, partial [Staurois parvus]